MSAQPLAVLASEALPASWHALPAHLRKPFWTVRETVEATGHSRSTLYRLWNDPRSSFPRRRGNRLPAVAVLRHMEGPTS